MCSRASGAGFGDNVPKDVNGAVTASAVDVAMSDKGDGVGRGDGDDHIQKLRLIGDIYWLRFVDGRRRTQAQIAADERRPGDDSVGEKGAASRGEEVALVPAEREEVEAPAAVALHERPGEVPLGLGLLR